MACPAPRRDLALPALDLPSTERPHRRAERSGAPRVPTPASATHVLRLSRSRSDLVQSPTPCPRSRRSTGHDTMATFPAPAPPVAVDRRTRTLASSSGRGTLGTAAFLLGLARRQLDLTVAYVRDRKQFGVPIGSFQAVKHPIADAVVGTEFAWPAVLRAAYSLVTGDPHAPLHVSMAKALASDARTRCRGCVCRHMERWATPWSTTCTCSPSAPGRWPRTGVRQRSTGRLSPSDFERKPR